MSTQAAAIDFSVSRLDFQNMESGYNYVINLDVEDEDGAAMPVTGWTGEMVITTFDGDPVATLTTGSGLDFSGNTISVTLSDTITTTMNGPNKYEMVVTVSAVEYPFLKGCITVS